MCERLAVIILTYNEELNVAQALRSVCGWANEVFVVDSLSSDRTPEIAQQFNCEIVQHPFTGYAQQRNWALENLPLRSEWVFFLDADEWLSEALKNEITATLGARPTENGFFVKRRLIWMGRWIKRGYYPTWLLRLFRRGKGRYEARSLNEHPVVEPPIGFLEHDLIHEDRRDLTYWVEKHNRYASREAEELLKPPSLGHIPTRFWGSQAERKRWLRYRVYNHLPLFTRAFLHFAYRYFLRGGFLDGKEGFVFHFLHGLWYQVLIDAKYLEMTRALSAEGPGTSKATPASPGKAK